MEQARLFIAIALSFLVFFLWQAFFVEKEPIPAPKKQPGKQRLASEKPYVQEREQEREKVSAPVTPVTTGQKQAKKTAKIITVDTPLYTVRISEKGGVFKSYVLKNYRESAEKDSPLKELISENVSSGTLQLGFTANSVPGLSEAVFQSDFTAYNINVNDQPKPLVLKWQSPGGIVIERRYLFSPRTYLIGHSIIVKNGSNRTLTDSVTIRLLNSLPDQSGRFGFAGPSALIDDKVKEVKIKKIKEKNVFSGNLRWVALQDRYFLSSIIPSSVVLSSMRLSLEQDSILSAEYVQPESTIPAGSQRRFDYEIYFGPKSVKILKEIGKGLDKAVDFGMFDFIAKPCLWLMNFFFFFFPNYGVAIIILTVITKILLWPLGVKSYKSMNEMKKLQPIMAQIREKYKGDKKKMNEEIMGLYRTYKINPMGGCLPMIAQIPVFFALYRMLYEAIELRHAPFFGWI
ncbi:MAG: membrane protein insertase YidC, partial [Deltaproteobacteria bacterium]|nr:membrane protein insertase YidC [Deltaproteobacteria bacterium]